MSFWEKPAVQKPWEQPAPQPMVLDEQAVAEIQGNTLDVLEEEEDTSDIMADANLRLEMGRLYQMVLQNDIFAETNADPRAIKNVQREIRKLVRERMETMLGIRQERTIQDTIVSSPFNDIEVTVLKMLASRASGGKTENQPQSAGPSLPPPQPKKDGITSISGTLRPATTPAKLPSGPSVAPKPLQKGKPAPTKSAIVATESALQKPIDQMSQEELLEYNRKAEERSKSQYAVMPNNMTPHPSVQQLEALYTMQAHDRLTQHAQKMTPNQ